jgi:hypothetical protein
MSDVPLNDQIDALDQADSYADIIDVVFELWPDVPTTISALFALWFDDNMGQITSPAMVSLMGEIQRTWRKTLVSS